MDKFFEFVVGLIIGAVMATAIILTVMLKTKGFL